MNSSVPLKVMYLSHTAMLGGGEIALLNLIKAMDRSSICPIVVLCEDGPLADALRPFAQVHVLKLPESIGHARKDSLGFSSLFQIADLFRVLGYARQLSGFIRAHQIDVVHANSLKADILGGISARLAGTPVIWHVRDRIEHDYLPRPVVNAFRWLTRLLPTFVVANSAATLKTLHLPPRFSGHFAVVHDGTNLPAPMPPNRSDELFEIGLVGRICPWKGQDIFVRSAALVRKKFRNVRFKIVGAALFGETEYENSIRALCSNLNLDDVVTFTGFSPDVPSLMQKLDLVVHASTIGEPFGQVIIEGMAAGKPVVATNGGGVPEIVEHGETGLLVPMGDAGAMADAICHLLQDANLRLEMGRRGRERVQRQFTIQRSLAGVQAVYAAIVEKDQSAATRNRPLSNQIVPAE